MGYVTCGNHPRQRCCWRCDRCPKCDDIGRLRRGDYCADCTAWFKANGFVWSAYRKDWVTRDDLAREKAMLAAEAAAEADHDARTCAVHDAVNCPACHPMQEPLFTEPLEVVA